MRLIGFNYEKIAIERFIEVSKSEKVSTHIDISSVEKMDSNLIAGSEKIVKVGFSYEIDYEPKFAKINFNGNVLFAAEEKIVEDIIDKWKEKNMDEDFRLPLFNIILRKANIKALQLEDEMMLPPHIPLQTIRPEKKDSKQN